MEKKEQNITEMKPEEMEKVNGGAGRGYPSFGASVDVNPAHAVLSEGTAVELLDRLTLPEEKLKKAGVEAGR